MRYGTLFAYVLGIRPWEIGYLSVAELHNCVAFIDEWVKQQKKS